MATAKLPRLSRRSAQAPANRLALPAVQGHQHGFARAGCVPGYGLNWVTAALPPYDTSEKSRSRLAVGVAHHRSLSSKPPSLTVGGNGEPVPDTLPGVSAFEKTHRPAPPL